MVSSVRDRSVRGAVNFDNGDRAGRLARARIANGKRARNGAYRRELRRDRAGKPIGLDCALRTAHCIDAIRVNVFCPLEVIDHVGQILDPGGALGTFIRIVDQTWIGVGRDEPIAVGEPVETTRALRQWTAYAEDERHGVSSRQSRRPIHLVRRVAR